MRNVLSRRQHRRPDNETADNHTPEDRTAEDRAAEDQAAARRGAASVQTPHQQPVRGRAHEHPRETSLAFVTITGGVIAFVCGALNPLHFVAVCVGIVTVVFGFYSQLVSATTAERWVNVIGLGLAFLGLGLGLRHGGFRI